MITPEILEEYRPYNDNEVPAAIQRIAENLYPELIQCIFPDMDFSEFINSLKKIKTVNEFQSIVMHKMLCNLLDVTIKQLSYSGVEYVSNERKGILLSNHRDIVLDAAVLQFVLYKNGLDTSEITFGNNLMKSQLIVDVGKINKMFKIVRDGTPREILINSMNVSRYMRYVVTQKKQSVWIAQRNGRSKDGNDKTEIAVLKMFTMSSQKNFVENLLELNITPIAVSYEYEPCDCLKTREIYISRRQNYIKSENEDLGSIIHGIQQYKGNMHIAVCCPLNKNDLEECAKLSHSQKFKRLADIIDCRIYDGYHLWQTNYIAHDLRSGKDQFSAFYTIEEKEKFTTYMQQRLQAIEGDPNELKEIFLGIYANPADAKKQ